MKYQQAKKYISEHKDMIGTTNSRGFQISRLLIVPTDEKKRTNFINYFVLNLGNISPEINDFQDDEDVEVWAVDTEHLVKANILFYDVIER